MDGEGRFSYPNLADSAGLNWVQPRVFNAVAQIGDRAFAPHDSPSAIVPETLTPQTIGLLQKPTPSRVGLHEQSPPARATQ